MQVVLPETGRDWAPSPVGRPLAYGETPWGIVIPLPDMVAGEEAAFLIGAERTPADPASTGTQAP